MRWLSRSITALLLAGLAVGGVQLIRAGMPKQQVGQEFRTYALMRDGSRLAVGSPVVIAGVRIGEVDRLSVEGGFARVDLRLRDATQIPRDSWITKRAESAFGDSYIEIIPPEDDAPPPRGQGPDPAAGISAIAQGSGGAAAVALRAGEPLTHVIEGGSTDTVLRAIGRAMPRIDHALDDAHDFLGTSRHWIDANLRERATGAEAWLAEGRIESGLGTADHAMTRFESGTTRAADAVASARPEVAGTLERADRAIADARAKIADVKGSLHDGLARVRSGLDDVDQPIADYRDVVSAIDEGRGDDYRGKLGRLINDPELADDLTDGTAVVRDGASGLTRIKSWLGMRFEYNVFSKIPRFYATAELRTRNDRFYLVELERDPLGGLPSDDLSDAAGTTSYTRTVTIKDELRFTAQFGKQIGWLALRGGVKDSTFGVGADALLLGEGRLRLSADLFGGFETMPRLKVAAAFAVFRSVYLLAGVDDVFTRPGTLAITGDSQSVPADFHSLRYGRDYFVGATLHFDDADLATLLRVYGALLVSAL